MLPLATIPWPDPLPMPAPFGLAWFLLLLTFFLHLLPMNLAFGGAVIGALLRARRGDPAAATVAHWIARGLPATIAATVTLGVAPLLFAQVLFGRLLFTSSVLMAWYWFAIVPVLILGYYGAYLVSFRGDRLGSWLVPVSWFTVAALAWVGFMFANNMSLMLRPEWFGDMYRQSAAGLHLDLGDPLFWPRWLHMVLGSLAVGGLGIAVLGAFRRAGEAAAGEFAMRYGLRWFGVLTFVNLVPALWLLFVLPGPVRTRVLGGSLAALAFLLLGALAGIVAAVLALRAARADDPAAGLPATVASLVVALVFMVLNRDQVRHGMLELAGFEPSRWVVPQWGPIVLFLVFLVVTIATVAWMVAAFLAGHGKQQAPRDAEP